MLLPGISETEISQFSGVITKLEPYQVPLDKALYAQNALYIRGLVGSRFGSSVITTLNDGPVTAFRNWFFTFGGAQVSAILYYAPSVGIRRLNQVGFTADTPIAQTGAAWASIVPSGQRAFFAFTDQTGRVGTAAGQVYGWNLGADPLFAAPVTNTPTITQPSVGTVTPGLHRIGFQTTTRNGYTGKLSPVNTNVVFSPVSFTATGANNVNVQINGPWPAYMIGGTVQIVMTSVANPNRYFLVPGATALAGGSISIQFNITDSDLVATGSDVTLQSSTTIVSQDLNNNPPFKPNAIFYYSSRLGYCGIDAFGNSVVYFSNPNNYQFITADQHGVYIEGQQQAVQGFSLRGVCYLGCTSGFYSLEDNGGVPISWTPPQRIDGSIGILSATCLSENPALGYALIAGEKGFYLFQGGIFPPLPLSYYQDSDWSRINWNVPTQVQIGDDQTRRRFIVAAPLNTTIVAAVPSPSGYTITTSNVPHLYQTGLACKITGVTGVPTITTTSDSTFQIQLPFGSGPPIVGGSVQPQTMSHQMTWDYTEGDTPETVKYSLDAFSIYRANSLALIRNLTTLLNEIWYAPAVNGPLIRMNDGSEGNPYRDVTMTGTPAAIYSLHETALHPNPIQAGMTNHDYHGAHLVIRGNGGLNMVAKGYNGVVTVIPARSPLQLVANPKNEILVKWFLRSSRQSFRLGTNAVDSFFVLSLLRMYWTESNPQPL